MVVVGKFSGRLYPLDFLKKTHETLECLIVLTDEEYKTMCEAMIGVSKQCIECMGCPYAKIVSDPEDVRKICLKEVRKCKKMMQSR